LATVPVPARGCCSSIARSRPSSARHHGARRRRMGGDVRRNDLPDGAEPIAQAYAGHQFGGSRPAWRRSRPARRRSDRPEGTARDIAFKGRAARLCPQRRRQGAVGRCCARRSSAKPCTRSASHHPSARRRGHGESSIANASYRCGTDTRRSEPHSVGTFEFLAARRDVKRLSRLAEHAIARHYPSCKPNASRSSRCCGRAERQAALRAMMNIASSTA